MKQFTTCANVANRFFKVLQGYTTGIRFTAILTLLFTLGVGSVWGAETTYTFTSKSWGDSSNGWESGKDGNALTSNQGVQVTTGVSGANATTKTSFTNVSSVAVQYCTNAKAGTGTINIQVGSNSAQSFSVSAPNSGGTTLKTKTFTFSPNQTGTVKISVDCTKNSIYIYSVTITTTDATTYTVTYNANGGSGTMSSSTGSSITILDCSFTAPNGKKFSEWNTEDDGSGTSYNPGAVVKENLTLFAIWEDLPKYTVTLKDDDSTLIQESAGGSVDLPYRDGCDDYTFVGWTSTWTSEQSNWTTTKPTIINAGAYTPTANVNLYPVYTKTETTEATTTTTDYVLTDLANIKSTDIVVITTYHSTNGTYAMSNNNGTSTAPTAKSVTVSGSKLSADPGTNYKWNISNNNGTLTIYKNGTTASWLYCISDNNGVRVGTNTNKTFTIDSSSGYLKHTYTIRYLGVYNKQDWRCYTSSTVNIGNQELKFYVETTTTTTTSTTTSSYISVPDCVTETRVSLDADGGTIEETGWNKQNDIYTQSFTASEQITLPTPTKAGNRFDGWYDENDNKVESSYTVPATDITLTAKWTAYTVNWTITPAEGGTLSATTGNTTSVSIDSEYEYESPAYTVTSGAAEVTQNNNTFTVVPTSNCTIQINLKLKPRYTVTLKDDDTELHQASFGASVELPSRESCKGYTFKGWTKTWSEQQDEWTDVAPDIIPAGDYTPTGDEELYPVYSKVEGGGTKFSRYEKVTADLDDWSGKYLIGTDDYKANGTYDDGHLLREEYTPSSEEKTEWEFTLNKVGDTGYSILFPDGSFYLGWKEGTDFLSSKNVDFSQNNNKYLWSPSTSGIFNVEATTRFIGVGANDFRPYATNSNAKCYLYKRIEEAASVTYYISVPNCCTPLATVNGKVQISNISETSATASWSWSSATIGISKNILKVYESNGALVKTIDGITPSATSQNITDLTTCTEYYATLTTVRSNESYCEGIEQGKSVNFITEAWNVTASLTNTSRLTGTDVACSSSDYVATFEAAADYALPETIIVEIGDEEKTAGSDYNWDKATGTLTIDASVIHGDINICIVAECIVTFNMNGHGVVPAPQIIEENGKVTEPSPAPKAEGYDFGGWFTDSECTSPYDFNSLVTASFTLYAKWTAKEYTITYDNLNGVNNDANPKTYTIESETITLKNLDDTNTHHFVGWYDEDDNLVTKIPQGSTGDITLYAKWVEIFIVKWYANGKELTNGELGSASTIVYEGEHISNLPPSVNLNNYCGDFVGWTDAEMDVNNVAKPNNLYTQASEFPNATGNQEFFAVFAE